GAAASETAVVADAGRDLPAAGEGMSVAPAPAVAVDAVGVEGVGEEQEAVQEAIDASTVASAEAREGLDQLKAVPQESARIAQPEALAGLDSLATRVAEAEVRVTTTGAQQRDRASAPAPITSALEARQVEGPSRTDAAAAEEVDDAMAREPLLSVPGHEVLDVTNLGEGSTPWGVRVRQRTADGRTFEVVHLEPGIEPAILPELESGAQEARAQTGFGWVLVRGPMSRIEVEELLAGLFPPEG
ncbi:MAG: hypothetical protein R3253_03100, partial [Longimicrobiales bacterium]|nr:hypothetical protein [Longimicrobiales bacterium]